MLAENSFMLLGLQLTPALASTYLLLTISILLALHTSTGKLAIGALLAALVVAFSTGLLNVTALTVVVALVIACVAHSRLQYGSVVYWLTVIAIVVLALALALHLVPGFKTWSIISEIKLTADAIGYSKSTNLDKMLVGVVLLIWCVPLAKEQLTSSDYLQASLLFSVVISLGFIIGMAAGLIAWQPKWHQLMLAWLLSNLLLSVVTEEVFFRGFLQTRLTQVLTGFRHQELIAVSAIALLFGMAHIGGGAVYAVIATLFGFGYGYVYAKTKSIRLCIASHLLANCIHFIFFTYPVLA